MPLRPITMKNRKTPKAMPQHQITANASGQHGYYPNLPPFSKIIRCFRCTELATFKSSFLSYLLLKV